jgi:hypothetical protein
VQLQATPEGGLTPLNVSFTLQASVPGAIQQVLYDFDGDNINGTQVGRGLVGAHTYTSAGQYFPVVTIQTSAGRFSSIGGWNASPAPKINVQEPPVQQSVINVTDPVDIKVGGPASHLYVLSRSSATITEFDGNGTSVRSLAAIGTTPTGLDVDGAGNFYVAMSGDNQVAKFNPTTTSFQLDTTFGAGGRIGKSDQNSGAGNGEFNSPHDVAVTKDGEAIYVSDRSNHRIQKLTKDGLFLSLIGSQGSGFGNFNNPKGLSVAKDGTLFVLDSGNNRLVRFMGDAVYKIFGEAGVAAGQYQSREPSSGPAMDLRRGHR